MVEERVSEDYAIRDGKLLYRGKEILLGGRYPFDNLCFKSFLGKGRNGITFATIHKFLNATQVVKLSNTTVKKNLLEAQKNAVDSVSETIAKVSDAAILEYPSDVTYSIMPFVENSVSLSQWVKSRDLLLELFIHNESAYNIEDKSGANAICQLSLNVCSAIIANYAKLVSNNIIHGDLNPGNILINDGFINSQLFDFLKILEEINNGEECSDEVTGFICKGIEDTIAKINDKIAQISLGSIQSNEIKIKLIDLGTSQILGTNILYGEKRDNYFLVDSIRKLLKPFFPGDSLVKYLNIDEKVFRADRELKFEWKSDYFKNIVMQPVPYTPIEPEKWCEGDSLPQPYLMDNGIGSLTCIPCIGAWEWLSRKLVTGDLLRLVTFLNVIYGYYSASGIFRLDEEKYILELNSYIKYQIGQQNNSNFLDINVFQASHVEAWEILIHSKEAKSTGELVDWEKLWDIFSQFAKSNTYEYTIFDYISIKDNSVIVTESGKEKFYNLVDSME